MIVSIVDYGMGNLASVSRALERCGAEVHFANTPEQIRVASRIVLPGVGSFHEAVNNLNRLGLVQAIQESVQERKVPLLGICLGMQLLATWGTEGHSEGSKGLNLIPGKVVRLESHEQRVPHVGWNEVHLADNQDPMFESLNDGLDFYFVHSYHFQADNAGHVLARTPYCGEFTSVVRDGSTYGAQFHPEKSSKHGQVLLRNFLSLG